MGNLVKKTFTFTSTLTIPAGVTQVTAVATKQSNPIGIRQSDAPGFLGTFSNMFTWGRNTKGELGVGDVTSRSTPTLVLGGLQFLKMFRAAGRCSAGLATNGQLYMWGTNANGQLGVGDVIPRSSPVLVLGGLVFQRFFFSEYGSSQDVDQSFGLTPSGQLYAWGFNASGQLGVGDVTPRSSPVLVLGGITFSDIKISEQSNSGVYDILGLAQDGTVYTWGVGTFTGVAKSTPTLISGLSNIVAIEAVGGSGYFLDSSGVLKSIGHNDKGQLGNGNTTDQNTPVTVLGGITFSKIRASTNVTSGSFGCNAYGVAANGNLYVWGGNQHGELGLNDNVSRSSPVLLAALSGVQDFFAASQSTNFALLTNGQLYAWGPNTNGALGANLNSGTTPYVSSPVLVVGGHSFVALSLYNAPSILALAQDGNLYSWGANGDGQLGLGNTASRSSPVAITSSSLPRTQNFISETKISVVPGTTYTVTIGPTMSYFDGTPLSNLGAEVVDVYYEQ